MAVESYWNVVQITICVFSALASVVCGYFGRHARGETGRRSVLRREWDDWEPQTSEIPHCRWSALYPLVYFSLPFLASHVKKKILAHNLKCVIKAMDLNCWRERTGMSIASLQHRLTHIKIVMRGDNNAIWLVTSDCPDIIRFGVRSLSATYVSEHIVFYMCLYYDCITKILMYCFDIWTHTE